MSKFGKTVLIVTVMVMAIVVATIGGTAVFAQNTDGGDNAPTAFIQDDGNTELVPPVAGENGFGQQDGPRNGRRGPGPNREAKAETLAEILGISVEELQAAQEAGTRLPELVEELGLDMDEVQAALQAARIAEIEEAVANGDITQEQADQILERIALKAVISDIFNKDEMQAVTADALGISVEELEAAREAGTRLPELAEELGVDIEDVQAAMETAKADALANAVADGLITQEQADEIASHDGRRGGPGGQHGNCDGPQGGPRGGQGGSGGRGQGNGFPSGQPQGGSFNQGFGSNTDA